MIDLLIPALISAVLYRIPRGGPSSGVWRRWLGFGGFGSFGGSVIWATGTALAIYATTSSPFWVIPLLVVLLVLAEMRGYMEWVSEYGVDVKRLTIRGLTLFNPLLGFWYWLALKNKDRLPIAQPILDGWTAYAEVASGFTTGFVVAGLTTIAVIIF